ncbi:MAG TPA: hypothetical protein VNE59_07270 [Burkholderiales bacterium]|nr:hypothetical protein [Burkholderiales bacterium]
MTNQQSVSGIHAGAMLRSTVAALAIAALGLLAPHTAPAQQSGGTRSPTGNGAAQGTVGGGATGAANRGGASGAMNPSPGGSPAEAGGPAGSQGPSGTVTRRPGYLGGRSTGTDDGDSDSSGGTSTTTTINMTTPRGPGSEVNCHDVSPAGMSATERLSGANMERIEDVRALVGGRSGQARVRPSRYLLANFQEELAKPRPDLTAAATYLGIAAQEPVTAELVLRASQLLCVPVSNAEAASISTAAESQRLKLNLK